MFLNSNLRYRVKVLKNIGILGMQEFPIYFLNYEE